MHDSHEVLGFDSVAIAHDPALSLRASRAHDHRAECNALYLVGTALTSSSPELLPQLLCDALLELCNAESTGICVEETDPSGTKLMRWVATAGPFAALSNCVMPRDGSPCGTCLDCDTPQLVSVHQAYYDRLRIRGAPLITQAILIPWHVQGANGTLWAMQHTPGRAFDPDDYLLLRQLAAFASLAMRHLQHEAGLRHQAARLATAEISQQLAQRVHNPLQAAVNSLYLATRNPGQAQSYIASAIRQIVRISDTVEELYTSHARPPANRLNHSGS